MSFPLCVGRTLPAVFMRGGTSKAVMFHQHHLPEAREDWVPIFLAAMGSPDPYGRQLDGMGGGISSLSKICVIGPSSRPDADVDYTFAQVQIAEARVDFRGNCGNMSSAVGPFAVQEGIVRADGDMALVRIFNTNTQKLIHARFPLIGGAPAEAGDLVIPGVTGPGAPVRLEFREPGGAVTGKLLPTGNVQDRLDVAGLGPVTVSLVDAANPCVFLRAADLGLSGTEMPGELDAMPDLLSRIQAVRRAASVAMGIAATEAEAGIIGGVPMIGFVAPPAEAPSLSGQPVAAAEIDLTARFISSGQPHRALPLTASLCTAVASRIEGTLVAEAARAEATARESIRIGMPSGILMVGADVGRGADGGFVAHGGSFYRTARRLFDGRIHLPPA